MMLSGSAVVKAKSVKHLGGKKFELVLTDVEPSDAMQLLAFTGRGVNFEFADQGMPVQQAKKNETGTLFDVMNGVVQNVRKEGEEQSGIMKFDRESLANLDVFHLRKLASDIGVDFPEDAEKDTILDFLAHYEIQVNEAEEEPEVTFLDPQELETLSIEELRKMADTYEVAYTEETTKEALIGLLAAVPINPIDNDSETEFSEEPEEEEETEPGLIANYPPEDAEAEPGEPGEPSDQPNDNPEKVSA